MNKPATVGSLLVIALAAFVAGRYSKASGNNRPAASKRLLYYVDPMHPTFHSDRPGIAPDCGMPLEPVYEDENPMAALSLPAGSVSIPVHEQQLIGVRVETVKRNSGSRSIRTSGRVEADDNRVYKLMAASEGWVQSLQNNPAGAIVKKDELLASFYSQEFRNAEQAYLGALASSQRVKTMRDPEDQNSNLRICEEQLHALGMGDPQIKELARTRQTTRDIGVISPVDGVVLARNVSPQQRFEAHTELYRIADLSKVWILADLREGEASGLLPGSQVEVKVPGLSKTLHARVSQNPPLFDAASHTLKLRLEAQNPGFVLRPDMFVDLEFTSKAAPGITVDQGSVLDSGLEKIVYVETADGIFERRPVETGAVYSDRVAITKGLVEGERVVTAGNFLVDSESRMRRSSPIVSISLPSAKEAPAHEVAMRDPVCGMALDPGKDQSSIRQEKYHGETFRFCSEKCRAKFQQNPDRYAAAKVGGVAGFPPRIEPLR
jgi:Cu(I)/Ag(I) efflux system membrane fusion protein